MGSWRTWLPHRDIFWSLLNWWPTLDPKDHQMRSLSHFMEAHNRNAFPYPSSPLLTSPKAFGLIESRTTSSRIDKLLSTGNSIANNQANTVLVSFGSWSTNSDSARALAWRKELLRTSWKRLIGIRISVMAFRHAIHNVYKAGAEYVMPVRSQSGYKDSGVRSDRFWPTFISHNSLEAKDDPQLLFEPPKDL